MFPADVANAAQIEAAAEAIEHELGAIDVWINNAMVSVFSPIKEMTAEEFRRVTEVTYLGVVHGTLAALKRMLPRDRGTIVQVGSALSYRSIPLQSAYCAAKHAERGFTDSLRPELIHDRSQVHVTMVQMPALNTPQFGWTKSRLPRKAQPVPPIFQPEIAAEAIYWAAHQKRREVFVGLATVKAIVGNKIAPGLLDDYLAKTAYDGQQTDEPEERIARIICTSPSPAITARTGASTIAPSISVRSSGRRSTGHHWQSWPARLRSVAFCFQSGTNAETSQVRQLRQVRSRRHSLAPAETKKPPRSHAGAFKFATTSG